MVIVQIIKHPLHNARTLHPASEVPSAQTTFPTSNLYKLPSRFPQLARSIQKLWGHNDVHLGMPFGRWVNTVPCMRAFIHPGQ
mgnify:CR=1 FL=1